MASLFQPPIFCLQQQQQQQQQQQPRYMTWTPIIQQPMFIPATPLTVLTPTMTVPVVIYPPHPPPLLPPPPPTTILIQPAPTPPLITALAPPSSQTINMRIIFYGRGRRAGEDEGGGGEEEEDEAAATAATAPLFLSATDAVYYSPPGRDKLLCDMACWAGQHGVVASGWRVEAARASMYVLPGGGDGVGARLGLTILPGVGPVMPGDVVRVVRLDRVDEAELAEAMEDVRRRGYVAVWAIDVDGEPTTSTTTTATTT